MSCSVDVYVRMRPVPGVLFSNTVTPHDDERSISVRLESARSGPLGGLACRSSAFYFAKRFFIARL